MALKCGIVGLPNVGKSTLFNCLSNAKAQSANYAFCTIEPNIGIVSVPDPRLNKLEELVKPQRVMPTTIEFVDIAGLVKGASKGEGLGNKFLGNIRETDAIIHVVRCFDDDNIEHVDNNVNPVRDKEVIDTELLLKDLETIEKRIDKQKKLTKSGDRSEIKILELYAAVKVHIEAGKPCRSFDPQNEDDAALLNEMQLLTGKPILYVCNVDESSVLEPNEHVKALTAAVADENAEVISVCAVIESEIQELESEEDKLDFLSDLGLKESGLNRLIQSGFKLLNLITYFTAGEKEVRAWTIRKGTAAPQAAGVIHSDFEKGFIRAEVIHYEDYVALGSENACKEAGKMNVEGKTYIVLDGDVMHFRFNV